MSMKLLISNDECKKLKSRDMVPLQCEQCKNTFYVEKHFLPLSPVSKRKNRLRFCGTECRRLNRISSIQCECAQCKKKLTRPPSWCKGKHTFCTKSCAAIWRNSHKTHGNRRSKLEVWLEKKLTEFYPNLPIDYNKTNAINAELDIYIPSLKLAFELNGIFHHEPIFGAEKLATIKTNDERKFQACLENNIELCIIDTHNTKYLKKERDQKFLDIIQGLIQKKII